MCVTLTAHYNEHMKVHGYHQKAKQCKRITLTLSEREREATKHNFIYIEIYRLMRLIRRLSKSSTPSFIHSRRGVCVCVFFVDSLARLLACSLAHFIYSISISLYSISCAVCALPVSHNTFNIKRLTYTIRSVVHCSSTSEYT